MTSHETRVGGPAISESLVCVDVTEAPRCVSLLALGASPTVQNGPYMEPWNSPGALGGHHVTGPSPGPRAQAGVRIFLRPWCSAASGLSIYRRPCTYLRFCPFFLSFFSFFCCNTQPQPRLVRAGAQQIVEHAGVTCAQRGGGGCAALRLS